ncbi:siderophore-interacting protein [Streptomyces liangshanensis]|uniref:siderophore-interacting protein n=1 Tax=Streptomyces liangshanensis TaxID=2717324 RepID=UPI0036DAA1BB
MTENADRPPVAAPRALPVRTVEVTGAVRLSPHMVRVTFGGPDLADFRSAGPDQQVKLYFPRAGQRVPRLPGAGAGAAGQEQDQEQDQGQDLMRWYGAFQAIPEDERPWARSYTIRSHDPSRGTVDVDFVLHGGDGDGTGDAGPATRWARSAAPGAVLGMFGPSAYFAAPVPLGTADWTLLAGDESALPAIGTIVEALPAGARAVAFVEVVDAAEEQRFGTAGDVTVHWIHRGRAPSGARGPLVRAVRDAVFPEGSVHAWLGGEAGAVRALRRHLVAERGFPRRSVDFTGYWRSGLAQDDAPTEADLAEARERLADAGIPAAAPLPREPLPD